MVIDVNAVWLVGLLLALVRSLAWLSFTPPFNARSSIPTIVTVATALGLAVIAAPTVAGSHVPLTTPGLLGAVAVQAFTGVVLGVIVQVLITAFPVAGALGDLLGGIVLPAAIDPLSENQTPLLGQFYEQVAVMLLFATGGELFIVDGFLRSFSAVGVTLSSAGGIAQVLTTDVATMFMAALEIACPILIVLFGAQVVLALLAKVAPQMNVWMLGFPLQVILAISLVAICIATLPDYVDNIVQRAVHDMSLLYGGG